MDFIKKFRPLILLVSVFVLCYSVVYYVSAAVSTYSEPLHSPTTCLTGEPGCDPPINAGPSSQLKTGNLQLKNLDTDSSDNLSGSWFYKWEGSYAASYNFVGAQVACQNAKDANGNPAPARLAYYSEIVEAYKNGANNCAAGWVQEGFGVYPMQNGAGIGCGGAVGGVRNWGGDLVNSKFGAYCARDSLKQYGSLGIGGNLYAKGVYLNSGQSGGQMYLGLLQNGDNADKLGICMGGVCKTDWSQIAGTNYWTVSGNNINNISNTNSGNVGIGTMAPGAKLHVADSGNVNIMVENTNPASNYAQFVASSGSVGNRIETVLFTEKANNLGGVGTNSNHGFYIRTNNIERMRIDKNGNVGIGTTNPGVKLEVAGQVKITGGTPGAGQVLTTVDGSGLATWEVAGGGLTGTGSTGQVTFWNVANSSLSGSNNLFWDNTNSRLDIKNNAANPNITEGLRLQNTVGMLSPAIYMRQTEYPSYIGRIFSSGGYEYFFQGTTDSGTNWFNIAKLSTSVSYIESGNFGIGTARPTAKLEVAGQVKITGGTPGNGKVLTSDANGLATWKVLPAGGGSGGLSDAFSTIADNVGTAKFSASGADSLRFGLGSGLTIAFNAATKMVSFGVDSAQTQLRVSSNDCAGANLSIKTINQNGTVTCETDDMGSGGTVGPGTNNRVAKFTTPTTIGDSVITDNGTNVVIGTAAAIVGNRLEVLGGPIKATGGLIMQTVNIDIGQTQPTQTGNIWMCTDSGFDCQ